VDLGLVTTIDTMLNLETIPIFEDQICLIAPPSYKKSISIQQLKNEPLLLFRSGSGFRRYLEEQFSNYHFAPKVAMELESIEAIIRFVQHGLGMAFLPEIAVTDELRAGSLKRITLDGWAEMKRRTFLIYRKDKYLTWPIQAFLEQVKGI
jgi:DNA-binding transcriptional LysR family regulator